MLIVIEGLDASGKTTQTKLLVERLQLQGRTVNTLDFPQYDNGVFGKILKKFLANEFCDSVVCDAKLSAMLFAADRAEHKHKITEWLRDPNAVVVLNRYIPSNIAYNRAKTSNDKLADDIHQFISQLEYVLLGLPKPDLVIVLGSSAAITKARLPGRSEKVTDAYEADAHFLDKVAEEYVKLCETEDNWQLLSIAENESIPDVHQRIWDLLPMHCK